MDFISFVEGPLLWVVSLIFVVAVITRLFFFSYTIINNSKHREHKWGFNIATFGRLFLPFHRAVLKKPAYALLRYVFHLCLIIVPIWLSGHISLWAESRFEWEWAGLPDTWADWMTIILVVLAIYFLGRRIVSAETRMNSSISDYLIISIAALPFVTGYFLTHDTLASIPFISENMMTIHVISGELMLISAAFLFCRTRLNERRCTGCASCELSCPTETLESKDIKNLRIFNYSHYQCICCGACVSTCPEDAAELRHEVSLKRYFQIASKHKIRAVELESCEKCHALFVPEPLLNKVEKNFAYDYIHLCPDCRKTDQRDFIRQLTPWTKKYQSSGNAALKKTSKDTTLSA